MIEWVTSIQNVIDEMFRRAYEGEEVGGEKQKVEAKVVKEGMLFKKGGMWNKRHVVLRDYTLFIYVSKQVFF